MAGNRFAPDLRNGKLRNRRPSHATVVAYLALFVALSGTAMAVDGPLAGQNTVGSEDIINSEVRTGDIGDAAVGGNDLAPDAVGSGKIDERQVKNADLSIGASSSEQPAFWKDPFGVVHLEGAVGCPDNADEGTVIFNFPPGFRPPVFSVLRYGALGGGQTLVQLATTSDGGGARLVYDGPDGDAIDDYISLDGITFRTEG